MLCTILKESLLAVVLGSQDAVKTPSYTDLFLTLPLPIKARPVDNLQILGDVYGGRRIQSIRSQRDEQMATLFTNLDYP